jgi:hypothetical protein
MFKNRGRDNPPYGRRREAGSSGGQTYGKTVSEERRASEGKGLAEAWVAGAPELRDIWRRSMTIWAPLAAQFGDLTGLLKYLLRKNALWRNCEARPRPVPESGGGSHRTHAPRAEIVESRIG